MEEKRKKRKKRKVDIVTTAQEAYPSHLSWTVSESESMAQIQCVFNCSQFRDLYVDCNSVINNNYFAAQQSHVT